MIFAFEHFLSLPPYLFQSAQNVLTVHTVNNKEENEIDVCMNTLYLKLNIRFTGNVIIFGLEWDATKTSPKYCHPTLYWYAYCVLLTPWACCGILVLGMIVQSMCNIVKGLCKK